MKMTITSGTSVQVISRAVLCVAAVSVTTPWRWRYLMAKRVTSVATSTKKKIQMPMMNQKTQSEPPAKLDAEGGNQKLPPASARILIAPVIMLVIALAFPLPRYTGGGQGWGLFRQSQIRHCSAAVFNRLCRVRFSGPYGDIFN